MNSNLISTPSGTAPQAPAWHALDAALVAEKLAVDSATGLTAAEADRRLLQHGANELRERPRRPPWRMLFDQFTDFMILVLIAAAVVAGVVGDLADTLAIVVIVLLNAVIGFVQEYRSERAMAALKQMAAANAVVLRDAERLTLPARLLVPGDVVLLEAGNIVPADLYLMETAQLHADESLLSGESATVEKHAARVAAAEAVLGDRHNMAYKGTLITQGRGRGTVVATGMATELGTIAALLDSGPEPMTPLQRRLAAFGRRLALAVLAICAILFLVGLLKGEAPMLMFLTAVSLAVAAIPEALPAVVTILLALGARRMARENALIRRLPAVETLGSVTFICSDKTGTLTLNRMSVQEIFADGEARLEWKAVAQNAPWSELFTAMALDNDAVKSSRSGAHHKISGDPTEAALLAAAADCGFEKTTLEQRRPRVLELPFDSGRRRMTTIHRTERGFVACTKGAPESVLDRCSAALQAHGETPMDRALVMQEAERMAADGLRVLAFAQRDWTSLPDIENAEGVENNLVFLGMVGLMDPPRAEAKKAVELCRTAGIAPVMITGDHPATARAIARRLEILGDGGEMMTGAELARLDQAALRKRVEQVRVYARVDPAQKIRIVEALQANGQLVAMTGDGVNDAPALKRADIGIAMGKGGTDVAREASSMVLLDDNFATIVTAVREGRRIFDNIRKFIRYAMTGNSAEIWTLFLAPLLGLPIPLLPIHILWVNLVTDGLPGLALAAEPAERGVMRRAPRAPQESLFAHGMWQHIIWVGLTIAAICLVTQALAIRSGSNHWQTMVFTVLTLAQMAHVLAIRSERESLFTQGLASNLPLLGAVTLTFVLQLATIYVPFLNPIFKTAPLTLFELGLCLFVSFLIFIVVEIEKALIRTGRLYPERAA